MQWKRHDFKKWDTCNKHKLSLCSVSITGFIFLHFSLDCFRLSHGGLTQERPEPVLELEVAGRFCPGVLRGHLAEWFAIGSWVSAGPIVVIVSVPEHLQFLPVGPVPDNVVIIRIPSSTATPLSSSSLASGHPCWLHWSRERGC